MEPTDNYKQDLIKKVEQIKSKLDSIRSYNEEQVKQGIVLPIIGNLGWDRDDVDEVFPEYPVGNNKVDYSLRFNGQNKVFIEVKNASEDLSRHEEQLLRYCFSRGVALALLTNGIDWWLYLPLRDGDWHERKFFAIDFDNQSIENIVEKLILFLEKEAVIEGQTVKNAEKTLAEKSQEAQYLQKLPEVWNELIDKPDELLCDLIAESYEGRYEQKPSLEVVKKFLKDCQRTTRQLESRADNSRTKSSVSSYKPRSHSTPLRNQITESSTNKRGSKSAKFQLFRETYLVQARKDMLVKIVEVLYSKRRNYNSDEQFIKKVHSSFYSQKIFISKYKPDVNTYNRARKIPNSPFWIQSNYSADQVEKHSYNILQNFGYNQSDLKIDYNNI